MTLRLSQRVGAAGKVYANDVQPAMLHVIEQKVWRSNSRTSRSCRGRTRTRITWEKEDTGERRGGGGVIGVGGGGVAAHEDTVSGGRHKGGGVGAQ